MNQKTRVLQMLRRGPTTTAEFLDAYIPRFPARIKELKAEGFVVTRERVSASSYAYKLISEPARPQPFRTPQEQPRDPSPCFVSGEPAACETLFELPPTAAGMYELDAA